MAQSIPLEQGFESPGSQLKEGLNTQLNFANLGSLGDSAAHLPDIVSNGSMPVNDAFPDQSFAATAGTGRANFPSEQTSNAGLDMNNAFPAANSFGSDNGMMPGFGSTDSSSGSTGGGLGGIFQMLAADFAAMGPAAPPDPTAPDGA